MKRAWSKVFVSSVLVFGFVVIFPHPSHADSSVRPLDASDTDQYGWVANGQPWFDESEEIVPSRVKIASVNIDIRIKRGGWQQGKWKINDHDVFFAPLPDKSMAKANSIFLYGHNTPQLLMRTLDIEHGDTLTLKLDSGPWVRYRYTGQDRVVDREDVESIKNVPTDLALLTCHGENNSLRRILYFELL